MTVIPVADRVIATMRPPSDMHILCIDVTNKCDLRCSNCTRLLVNQKALWDMTPENFRLALRSLKGYRGVIAMIGGNPCMHPKFLELCQIFMEEIPEQRQRGLWSNNVFKFQEAISECFGFFNLNPHNDPRGLESLERLKELIPNIEYYKGASQHAPLLAAMSDLYPNEQEMWSKIGRCDINRNWSASIVENQGELRAYFCEVAASFDLARGEDHGLPVIEGWWQRAMSDFAPQVKKFCPGCGVPARLKGQQDDAEIDDYTISNQDIARSTKPNKPRKINLIEGLAERGPSDHAVTDYNEVHHVQGASGEDRQEPRLVSVVIPYFRAQDTIKATIQSVLDQTGIDIEIILVDDASPEPPDLSGLVGPIRTIRLARNSGPATARNAGLRLARGRYVCFLDSDDQYAPGFFDQATAILERHPEVVSVTCGIELVNCHRFVNQYYFACVTNAIPSNLIARTRAARLIGGFPEDIAFRGPAAGEDACFKAAMGLFPAHHLGFPFLRYMIRRGSHFDLFLDSTRMEGGRLIAVSQTPQEQDGSLGAAAERYHKEAALRVEQETIAVTRGYPLRPSSFILDPVGQSLAEIFAGLGGDLRPEEGYALYRWAAAGPGTGAVIEVGSDQARSSAWLAAGCRDGNRAKLISVSAFGGHAKSPVSASSFLIGPVISTLNLYPEIRAGLGQVGLADWGDLHQTDPAHFAARFGQTVRMLVVHAGDELALGALNAWLSLVENQGAFVLVGVDRSPLARQLFDHVMRTNNAVRLVFSIQGLRFFAGR